MVVCVHLLEIKCSASTSNLHLANFNVINYLFITALTSYLIIAFFLANFFATCELGMVQLPSSMMLYSLMWAVVISLSLRAEAVFIGCTLIILFQYRLLWWITDHSKSLYLNKCDFMFISSVVYDAQKNSSILGTRNLNYVVRFSVAPFLPIICILLIEHSKMRNVLFT